MSPQTPLPSAKAVRELVEGLVGRDVQVTTGGAMLDPAEGDGTLVGAYVDDRLALTAIVLLDLPLAAYVGAALGLVPARTAESAVAEGVLPSGLQENAGEVLNVLASLFNAEGAPHVRLDTIYPPGGPLPADVATWVPAFVRRTDLDMEVSGYGPGRFSLLVL
ncbi:hypothetical protein [Cellulomonas fengjieae]|uniref:Chemotaxis phosphatase CheX-like domain-containing protein n=1 Tax=Cellulomonas fengjieae TaxID=2819978 RepID=A0ABS3SNW6_9CELL|nr:hypothetical protein [Cellulomonas fengjieae]MBO3086660.1 hypothetical protein [Cellulomonas fengjieae]MBO3100652.1 hypothetical protein [Cellulomonas fengjieae]QVI66492.1 hypothetical protein KG102_02470 [Cellulomonas fengjieae]